MRARWSASILAAGVCAAGLVALVLSVIAAPNDGSCDNIAGTCLRQRQGVAITAIEAGCLVAALIAAACLLLWVQGHRPSPASWSVVVVCGLLAATVIVVQPVDHLNNRWHGWLSDGGTDSPP